MPQAAHKQEFDSLYKAILKSLPDDASPDVRLLAEQFYDKLPAVDLEGIDPKAAAKTVAAAYDFMQARTPGMPKIKVTHAKKNTAVEILNDDMPFLFDSVVAEFGRQGINIHSVFHPIVSVKRDAKGKLSQVAGTGKAAEGCKAESYIRIEAAWAPDKEAEERVTADLLKVLE